MTRRRLSRRNFVLGGAATLTGLAATRAPGARAETRDMCVATDAAIEGPYYAAAMPVRADIREGKEGVRLDLELRIVDAATCRPIGGPMVDVWHCDAGGLYSRFTAVDPAAFPMRGARVAQTDEEDWLRGRQQAGLDGFVRFRTIYPGRYSSRTPHIHGKVWTRPDRAFTFQTYFPDSLNREIALRAPYSRRPPSPTTNAKDIVVAMWDGGKGSSLNMSRAGDGFRGTLTVAIPPS